MPLVVAAFLAPAFAPLIVAPPADAADAPAAAPPADRGRSTRVKLPPPPANGTPEALFAYVAAITDPALEPESTGRRRFHRRKVASLVATAADTILAQLPDDDPRVPLARTLKHDAEAAALPPEAAADAGAERRLALPGKPIELEGRFLDGSAFDPARFAGKVVLVDFWATWCGPCVAEIPRVRDLYDRYHARGFEVVGISLDDDRDDLQAFIEDRDIPWPIIHDERPADGGRSLLATRYGIAAIPTMILVGRDGNVISIEARGQALEALLEEQFPDELRP